MKIAEVLERHGSSLKEVARAIGMKPSTLQTTIDGNPTVGTLRKIAEAARCPLAEFFEDELLEAGLRIVAAPSPSAGSESASSASSPSAGSERSAGSEGQWPSEGQEREQGAEGLPFGNGEKEHTAHRPTALGMYACPYCGRGVTIEVKGV